jgi:hypothetical protein
MSTSSTARRAAPPLAALTVLLLLAGVLGALRSGSPPSGRPGAALATPPVLRLSDYRAPGRSAEAAQQLRLGGALPVSTPDPVALRALRPPAPAAMAELARSLGVSGTGRSEGAATVFGSGTRTLVVQEAPGGPWQYAAGDAQGCPARPTLPRTPMGKNHPGLEVRCEAAPQRLGTGSADGAADGVAAGAAAGTSDLDLAAAVLRAAGIDAAQRRTQLSGSTATVLARPAVAGLPTAGLTTSVRVDGSQVLDAGGWLVATEQGPRYPVINARQAWDRLRRTPLVRTSIGCTESLAARRDQLGCCAPTTVTGARLGLSLQHEGDRPVLVPAWLFRVQGCDEELPVVAVPQSLLADDASGASAEPGSPGTGTGRDPRGAGTDPGATQPATGARLTVQRAGRDALTVRFTGGVAACWTYRVLATEQDQRVLLTLTEKVAADRRCIELAQEHVRTVHLNRPLGDRQVLDARTGALLLDRPR